MEITPFAASAARLPLALIGALALASCGEVASSVSGIAAPAALEAVSGDGQVAAAAATLPEPLVVRVLDDAGRPMAGQAVEFRVVAGGGSVRSGIGSSDGEGLVRERWTLGSDPTAPQRVEARVASMSAAAPELATTFVATVASASPPPVGRGARYPNQPSWSRVSECALASGVPSMDGVSGSRVDIPGCAGWSTSNGSRYDDGRPVSRRLDDAQAPTSPNAVWDVLFAGGQVYDGVGPGTLFRYLYDYGDGWDGSFYWAFSLKLSENWVHHGTVQKLVHLKTDDGETIILSFDGKGGPLELYVGGRYHDSNQPGTVSAREMAGKWMRIELRWDASTGRARWWLNGVLQGDHSGLPRTSEAWAHTFFDPTYGGRSSTALPADQRMYLDHVLFAVPD